MISTTVGIAKAYQEVRTRTMEIVAPLEIEDYVVQTAPYMSPPRWHMGHTTWFFEMLLKEHLPGYELFNNAYLYFFNSYYDKFGARIGKEHRGTKSRPTVRETVDYRNRIDEAMERLIRLMERGEGGDRLKYLVRLGLEHEMQHQELLVYDIKHLLCGLYQVRPAPTSAPPVVVKGMADVPGGLFWLGYGGDDFAFDNEKPAHQVFIRDFAIDRAPISNGEYHEFIRDGGYRNPRWWLSEGWKTVNTEHWEGPLYWELQEGDCLVRDFKGDHRIREVAGEPVSHVSFYEASAYAKWAGKRLPTEAEWERAARLEPESGASLEFPWGNLPADAARANLLDNGVWGVARIGSHSAGESRTGCHQMIGDVWEWTSSDYSPYPGFEADFDEYNDKWMVGQRVLRGGSFATPRSHIRSTYRNFFYPHERWMVAGFRCARTL